MADVKTKTYAFEVRETTVREAWIEAASVAEARDMLRRWTQNQEPLADMGGPAPIQLGDMESIKKTFRRLPTP